MKKPALIGCVFWILVVVCQLAYAQSPDESKIKQVLNLDNARVAALLRGDIEPLKRIYADDYTLITEEGAVQTKTARFDAIKSGRLKFEKYEIVERLPRVYGDTVIMLSHEKLTISLNGKPAGGDLRLTRVYKLLGKKWYLVATHATTIK